MSRPALLERLSGGGHCAVARHSTEFGEELSSREIVVLQLAADGLTQREIADQLFISDNTVKTHLKATRAEITRVIIAKGGRRSRGVRHTPDVAGLTCSIVVSGELGSQFDGVFGDLALSHETGTTRLSGPLTDQAELQGVLRQLFDLGLEILSISTHPGGSPPGEQGVLTSTGGSGQTCVLGDASTSIAGTTKGRAAMTNTPLDELGPVDYVVVEFPPARATSPARWPVSS